MAIRRHKTNPPFSSLYKAASISVALKEGGGRINKYSRQTWICTEAVQANQNVKGKGIKSGFASGAFTLNAFSGE